MKTEEILVEEMCILECSGVAGPEDVHNLVWLLHDLQSRGIREVRLDLEGLDQKSRSQYEESFKRLVDDFNQIQGRKNDSD